MSVCAAGVVLAANLLAQPVFRGTEIFPPEEFAARRAKVIAQIGDGVAIVLGTTEPPGEMPFRQNSQFFYLTGVTEPRASVIIDGRTKTDDGLPAAEDERRRQQHVRPGAWRRAPRRRRRSASTPCRRSRGSHGGDRRAGARQRTIYTPFAAEVLGQPVAGRSDALVDGQPGRIRGTAAIRAKRPSSRSSRRRRRSSRSRTSIRSSTHCAR